MKIALVGPGRAGTALAIAMERAGHDVVAVAGRDPERTAAVAASLDAIPVAIGDPLPADLVLIAVRDDAITEVAAELAEAVDEAGAVVHVSGATSVTALEPIADRGTATGSFHPLQTLPSAEAGAERLDGAWVAVTAAEPLRSHLHDLATSIGARPFDLADEHKALYHAAASAAANFPVVALGVAHDLFVSAGVPFEAARPLVEAAVSNAFEHGPRAALTGPIARGDRDTVAAQLEAVAGDGQWTDAFGSLVAAAADYAGTADQLEPGS